jgi:hypothetical protein
MHATCINRWSQAPQVAAMDAVMDVQQACLLRLRVLLSEAVCCWARLRHHQGHKDLGLVPAADAGDCYLKHRDCAWDCWVMGASRRDSKTAGRVCCCHAICPALNNVFELCLQRPGGPHTRCVTLQQTHVCTPGISGGSLEHGRSSGPPWLGSTAVLPAASVAHHAGCAAVAAVAFGH